MKTKIDFPEDEDEEYTECPYCCGYGSDENGDECDFCWGDGVVLIDDLED